MRASAGWAPAAPCPSPSPPAPPRHSPASQVPLLGTISPGGHYTSLITGIRIIITNCPCLHSVLCHNVMMGNITTIHGCSCKTFLFNVKCNFAELINMNLTRHFYVKTFCCMTSVIIFSPIPRRLHPPCQQVQLEDRLRGRVRRVQLLIS